MNEAQTTRTNLHGCEHIFASDARYRVIADCDVSLWRVYRFHTGEVLTFCRDYYSHYDSLSLYQFRTTSGEERYWALHDSEPTDKWRQYFERVGDTAP